MRKSLLVILLLTFVLTGCASSQSLPEVSSDSVNEEIIIEAMTIIQPLPDTTMEALNNSIVNISFGMEDLYIDASGNSFLRMQIYSYDKFDMVDISGLKAGDRILLNAEEIMVNTVERNDHGTVYVNGGLEEGGFDLSTDENGIYFVHGYSDMKSWNLVGEAEYPVSDVFIFTDSADLDMGTVSYDIDDLLNNLPEEIFGYQPQNTTVRIENGQIVAMDRIYTP